MRRQRLKKEGKISIPTASMSDIAFLLLIFFMVSTVFRKEIGLKVTLPEARATERIVKTRNIAHVYIDKNGRISVDDVIVQPKDVTLRFKLKLAENPAIISHVKADKRVKYDYVDKVLEALREAKALRVVFATDYKR